MRAKKKHTRLFNLLFDDMPHRYWLLRGDAARRRGDFDIAIRSYGRARRAQPHLAEAWVEKGRQLLSQGRAAEADAAFGQAHAVRPHSAEPLVHLGNMKLEHGDREQAGRLLMEAFRRDCTLSDVDDTLRGLGLGEEAERIRADEDRSPLVSRIGAHYWWHSIDLGNGLVTPGQWFLEHMAWRYEDTFSPIDLEGRTVVDFGAWNGAFSVEAARRGATRVMAVDHYTWTHPAFRGRQTFDLVNRVTGLGIEARDIDLDGPQLDLSTFGRFDVVLFLGVFYHLRDPLVALREVAALAREVLVVETHTRLTLSRVPSLRFYPSHELEGDTTNWWSPNVACIVALLKLCGFARVTISSGSAPFRKVFHAYRT